MMKYIEETKETMDKNLVKLTELAETIGEIHTGETRALNLFQTF